MSFAASEGEKAAEQHTGQMPQLLVPVPEQIPLSQNGFSPTQLPQSRGQMGPHQVIRPQVRSANGACADAGPSMSLQKEDADDKSLELLTAAPASGNFRTLNSLFVLIP